MTERHELLVLAGFELLQFQPLDRRAPGLGIELDFFHPQLAVEQRVVGFRHGGLVARQFRPRPGLILGEFGQILGQGQKAAVTVLENQQRANFILHARWVNRPARIGKDY